MRIGTREIGPDQPPYIIAELGVNHDGDPKRALELVRLAAQAGADAIKLQLFEADRLMSKSAKLAAYQKAAGETDPIEMLRRLELSIDDMAPCVALAHELGIHAIVSVFSVELVPVAERLPWDAYKTASPDIINKPLLDALAATGKPLIVSTGASTIEEVERMVTWIATPEERGRHTLYAAEIDALFHNTQPGSAPSEETMRRFMDVSARAPLRQQLAILQCVSSYPTPEWYSCTHCIGAINKNFGGPVGYSDHTAGIIIGIVAVCAGATILEKHFTYDRSAKGPDHHASLTPRDFRRYVLTARCGRDHTMVRDVDVADRDLVSLATHPRYWTENFYFGPKEVLPIEQDVRTVSRQSLTTTRALPAGHVLTRDDLTIKRPGTGIPPFELDATIGKRLARDVEADVTLTREDVQ